MNFKRKILNKNVLISFFLLFFNINLFSKEPVLAILKNVYSNSTQKFGIENYGFYCTAYGIVSVDTLYEIAKPESRCKQNITSFYKKNPLLKYYAANLLNVQQMYHIEFKKKSCLIYASGEITLSELLLKKGLALVKRKFKDEELAYRFKNAARYAKSEKLGIFSEHIETECLSEINEVSNK